MIPEQGAPRWLAGWTATPHGQPVYVQIDTFYRTASPDASRAHFVEIGVELPPGSDPRKSLPIEQELRRNSSARRSAYVAVVHLPTARVHCFYSPSGTWARYIGGALGETTQDPAWEQYRKYADAVRIADQDARALERKLMANRSPLIEYRLSWFVMAPDFPRADAIANSLTSDTVHVEGIPVENDAWSLAVVENVTPTPQVLAQRRAAIEHAAVTHGGRVTGWDLASTAASRQGAERLWRRTATKLRRPALQR